MDAGSGRVGPVSFRTYFDVPDADRSALGAQIAEQRRRVAARLAKVRRVVLVMSGKGGVGKSYLTAALARAIVGQTPSGVGVLDGDLRSPTVARLLQASGPLTVLDDGVNKPMWFLDDRGALVRIPFTRGLHHELHRAKDGLRQLGLLPHLDETLLAELLEKGSPSHRLATLLSNRTNETISQDVMRNALTQTGMLLS